MRKSKFLTVCFGAGFGAGQMYLGMNRQGITLMGGTALLGFLSSLLHVSELLIFIPVIWCYAFFSALNAYPLSEEERKQKDHEFVQRIARFFQKEEFDAIIAKRHLIIGWGCIAIGADMLFGRLILMAADITNSWRLTNLIWQFHYDIPRLLFAAATFILGVKLLRGSMRKELVTEPEN